MTKTEVITSVERRRRWSAAEKERLVAATLEPGASVSALARAAGMHPSQLYGWRRQLCSRATGAPRFTAVQVAAESGATPALSASGVIEIEFATGARMRITGAVDVTTVSAAVAALANEGRRR
jgi:transposase